MADKKVYCYCENGCKYETMTKEEILAAITQAVENGTVGNCDTGFIQTIKTINGLPLRFFVGAQYEFEALSAEDKKDLFAIITNDTTFDGITESIEQLREEIKDLAEELKTNYTELSGRLSDISDKKVFCSSINNQYSTIIEPSADFKFEKLPDGKSLDDIVGVGVDVKNLYKGEEGFLKFSGCKIEAAKYNETTGKEEVAFYLTAAISSNKNTMRGAFAKLILYVDEERFVHVIFKSCSYWQKPFNQATNEYENSINTTNGGFGLGSIVYWFA